MIRGGPSLCMDISTVPESSAGRPLNSGFDYEASDFTQSEIVVERSDNLEVNPPLEYQQDDLNQFSHKVQSKRIADVAMTNSIRYGQLVPW